MAAPAWTRAELDDEQNLIERARRDRTAFTVLYRRHYEAIARYIHRRVGDSHTTEDLTAEVFIAALRTLPRYRHRGWPLRTWLYRIATNRVNRWARRERKRVLKRLESDHVDPKGAANEAGMNAEYVRTALLTLSPKHQAVLSLHYLEGMPVDEVAVAVGCRIGTVKSRLARGREALRRHLEQRRSRL